MLKAYGSLIYRSLMVIDAIVSGLLFLLIAVCTNLDFTGCWGAHPLTLSVVTAVATLSFPFAVRGFGLYNSNRRNSLSEVCTRLLAASAISSFAVGITATVESLLPTECSLHDHHTKGQSSSHLAAG